MKTQKKTAVLIRLTDGELKALDDWKNGIDAEVSRSAAALAIFRAGLIRETYWMGFEDNTPAPKFPGSQPN